MDTSRLIVIQQFITEEVYQTIYFQKSKSKNKQIQLNHHYTEHCSVGPTKLIETTTIASMRMKNDEDFYGWWRFLNLDF